MKKKKELTSTHIVIYFDLSKTNNVQCIELKKCNYFVIRGISHKLFYLYEVINMNIAYLKIIFASKMSPQGAQYRLLPF